MSHSKTETLLLVVNLQKWCPGVDWRVEPIDKHNYRLTAKAGMLFKVEIDLSSEWVLDPDRGLARELTLYMGFTPKEEDDGQTQVS